MISRIFYIATCGLLLGGIIHITVILLIPYVGSRDAAKQIMSDGPYLQFTALNTDNALKIADMDPFFKSYVCRFNLTENGVYITGDKTREFWSASIFDDKGRVVYSMNDRTAIKNNLKIVIVNPIQMADIRQAQPEEIETSILVETSIAQGFVVLRALVRDDSQQEQATRFLEMAKCEPYATR